MYKVNKREPTLYKNDGNETIYADGIMALTSGYSADKKSGTILTVWPLRVTCSRTKGCREQSSPTV